jgi:RimJ/RimL family protein N-acetyltransferase
MAIAEHSAIGSRSLLMAPQLRRMRQWCMSLYPDYPVLTARLRLRPLTDGDAGVLVSCYALHEVHRYIPIGPLSVEEVDDRLRRGPWSRSTLEHEGEVLGLGVELASTGELIGDVLLIWTSKRQGSGEIGWVIHPAYTGQGFGTESTRAILKLAFEGLGLHRVIARIDARNARSLRLADRLGMRREAHLIRNRWTADGWTDEVDFAMLSEEWTSQADS